MRMREHKVELGENLRTISTHYYGNPEYALVIWQHNRDIIPVGFNVSPGQSLVIPHIPQHARAFG